MDAILKYKDGKIKYKNGKEIKKKLNNKIKWSFVFYIFCVIFAPPILPINFLFILSLYSILMIYLKYRSSVNLTIRYSGIDNFFILFWYAALYIILIMGVKIIFFGDDYYSNYLVTIYRLYFLIPMQLICICYILLRSQELNYNFKQFILSFIYAGIIQSIIALLALLFPGFKELLLEIMQQNTGSTSFFKQNAYSYAYTYRYFGFSATLLDTFGFGTGILLSFVFFLSFAYNTKYLFFAPFALIAPFLNSRTGLLIGLMGFVFAILLLISKLKPIKLIKMFIISIFVAGAVFISYRILINTSPNTINWVIDGIESITAFIMGNEYKKYSIAYNLFSDDFWTIPEGFTLIFGSGHTAYGLRNLIGFHSDVGYINHLWLGGVIGTILILLPVIWLFLKSFLFSSNRTEKILVIFLCVAFFLTFIKADLIGYNPGTIVLLTTCFYLIYKNNPHKV